MHDSDPSAIALVQAIRDGDTATLSRLLQEHPGIASEQVQGTRTPLHVATDWPGYFPNGPAVIRMLIEAGADPNADTGGDKPETPLHWAASSDDADVADALINCGASIETPGGSIGTPLDNAIGYGCWHVARLLVHRGARVDELRHAAAVGMMPRVEELLATTPPPSSDDINEAFWQASPAKPRSLTRSSKGRPAGHCRFAGRETSSPGDIRPRSLLHASATRRPTSTSYGNE